MAHQQKLKCNGNLLDPNSEEISKEEYWESHLYPDADEVLAVAENWSINPMKIESFNKVEIRGIYGKSIQ